MDDIDPHDETSPPIIHVVSYSEASHLATPDIINESVKITQYSLQKYRELRRAGKIEDMSKNIDVQERMVELIDSARTIISGIENMLKIHIQQKDFIRYLHLIFTCTLFMG